jgi:hypothetical protein
VLILLCSISSDCTQNNKVSCFLKNQNLKEGKKGQLGNITFGSLSTLHQTPRNLRYAIVNTFVMVASPL